MAKRRALSSMPEGTSGNSDADALAEMRGTMDDVHNISHFQLDSKPLEEMEMLDP